MYACYSYPWSAILHLPYQKSSLLQHIVSQISIMFLCTLQSRHFHHTSPLHSHFETPILPCGSGRKRKCALGWSQVYLSFSSFRQTLLKANAKNIKAKWYQVDVKAWLKHHLAADNYKPAESALLPLVCSGEVDFKHREDEKKHGHHCKIGMNFNKISSVMYVGVWAAVFVHKNEIIWGQYSLDVLFFLF